jgi:phytoene synthase
VSASLAGTPRYFAWLYSAEPLQAILKSLFGIEAEIKAALQPDLEHSVAHVRVTWWAEEAERLRAGQPLHPLTRSLLAQRPPGAAAADISGLVEVATWDLACATFETGSELAGYCDRWARATTQLAAAWAAAGPAPEAAPFGHALGVALCELEMLIRLQDSARAGRVRLPLDELTALGVTPAALAQLPWPESLSRRLRERHRQLRSAVNASCALLHSPAQRVALRGLLVWAALLLQHSRRAEQALPRAWRRSRWDGLSDALRAWRAARGALHFNQETS